MPISPFSTVSFCVWVQWRKAHGPARGFLLHIILFLWIFVDLVHYFRPSDFLPIRPALWIYGHHSEVHCRYFVALPPFFHNNHDLIQFLITPPKLPSTLTLSTDSSLWLQSLEAFSLWMLSSQQNSESCCKDFTGLKEFNFCNTDFSSDVPHCH